MTNAETVRAFINAWSNLDVDEIVDYFAPDGTYYNIPAQPISGHDNLRAFIGGFSADWKDVEWEILSLVAEGDRVAVERMDRMVVGGKKVELPCFGMFEMQDGKIREFRDYFDMSTFMKAIAP